MNALIEAYKNTMANFPCGVTIVTSLHEGLPYGITVSSFTSVSVNPPLILISIDECSQLLGIIRQSQQFAVNILSDRQKDLGLRFGTPRFPMKERFHNVELRYSHLGNPIFHDAIGHLDCQVDHEHTAKDHVIFLGKVVACAHNEHLKPILYYKRDWRKLHPSVL